MLQTQYIGSKQNMIQSTQFSNFGLDKTLHKPYIVANNFMQETQFPGNMQHNKELSLNQRIGFDQTNAQTEMIDSYYAQKNKYREEYLELIRKFNSHQEQNQVNNIEINTKIQVQKKKEIKQEIFKELEFTLPKQKMMNIFIQDLSNDDLKQYPGHIRICKYQGVNDKCATKIQSLWRGYEVRKVKKHFKKPKIQRKQNNEFIQFQQIDDFSIEEEIPTKNNYDKQKQKNQMVQLKKEFDPFPKQPIVIQKDNMSVIDIFLKKNQQKIPKVQGKVLIDESLDEIQSDFSYEQLKRPVSNQQQQIKYSVDEDEIYSENFEQSSEIKESIQKDSSRMHAKQKKSVEYSIEESIQQASEQQSMDEIEESIQQQSGKKSDSQIYTEENFDSYDESDLKQSKKSQLHQSQDKFKKSVSFEESQNLLKNNVQNVNQDIVQNSVKNHTVQINEKNHVQQNQAFQIIPYQENQRELLQEQKEIKELNYELLSLLKEMNQTEYKYSPQFLVQQQAMITGSMTQNMNHKLDQMKNEVQHINANYNLSKRLENLEHRNLVQHRMTQKTQNSNEQNQTNQNNIQYNNFSNLEHLVSQMSVKQEIMFETLMQLVQKVQNIGTVQVVQQIQQEPQSKQLLNNYYQKIVKETPQKPFIQETKMIEMKMPFTDVGYEKNISYDNNDSKSNMVQKDEVKESKHVLSKNDSAEKIIITDYDQIRERKKSDSKRNISFDKSLDKSIEKSLESLHEEISEDYGEDFEDASSIGRSIEGSKSVQKLNFSEQSIEKDMSVEMLKVDVNQNYKSKELNQVTQQDKEDIICNTITKQIVQQIQNEKFPIRDVNQLKFLNNVIDDQIKKYQNNSNSALNNTYSDDFVESFEQDTSILSKSSSKKIIHTTYEDDQIKKTNLINLKQSLDESIAFQDEYKDKVRKTLGVLMRFLNKKSQSQIFQSIIKDVANKQYDKKYEFFERSDYKKYEDVIIDAYNEQLKLTSIKFYGKYLRSHEDTQQILQLMVNSQQQIFNQAKQKVIDRQQLQVDADPYKDEQLPNLYIFRHVMQFLNSCPANRTLKVEEENYEMLELQEIQDLIQKEHSLSEYIIKHVLEDTVKEFQRIQQIKI